MAPRGTMSGAGFQLEAFIGQQLGPDAENIYEDVHREVDRMLLLRVLEYTGGNQHHAARVLGISRQTFGIKLNDVGLQVTQSVKADTLQPTK